MTGSLHISGPTDMGDSIPAFSRALYGLPKYMGEVPEDEKDRMVGG